MTKVGIGHSSPVVAGESVYIFSRQEDQEVVEGLRLQDGKILWRTGYPAPYQASAVARRHGNGPKSTPVIHQGKLYTLGISGILSCFETGHGKLVWRKEFAKQFRATAPLYGVAMSPLAVEGKLIVHVGGDNAGALVAFDTETGALRWAWDEDGPGYSSPIVASLQGMRQVVTQTQNFVVGLALDDGRLLWKIPFKTPYDQNIVTPVAYEDLLIFSGHTQRTFSVRVARAGGGWTAEDVWSNAEAPMYMSSPVTSGRLLFGFTERQAGNLFCLDARTGKILWLGPGRLGDSAALVIASKRLLMLNTDGRLTIAAINEKAFEPLARYQVAESPTWAHPALVGESILIKDQDSLALWTVN